MRSLREFFNEFSSSVDKPIVPMWTYEEQETEHGIRRTISFLNGVAAVIQEQTEAQCKLSIMVIQSMEHLVYKNAAYLLYGLFEFYLEPNIKALEVTIYGSAYQAILGIEGSKFKFQPISSKGTISTIDRYNRPKDIELSRINKIIVTKG